MSKLRNGVEVLARNRDGQQALQGFLQVLYTKKKASTPVEPAPTLLLHERVLVVPIVLPGRLREAFRKVQGLEKVDEPVVEPPLIRTPCLHEELYKKKRAISPKERRTKGSFRCNAQWLPKEAQDAVGGIRDRVIDSREEDLGC